MGQLGPLYHIRVFGGERTLSCIRNDMVIGLESRLSICLRSSVVGFAKLENADYDGHQGQYGGEDAENDGAG